MTRRLLGSALVVVAVALFPLSAGNYPVKHAAKPPNCGARILRLQPKADLEELGSVLLEGSVFVTPSDRVDTDTPDEPA